MTPFDVGNEKHQRDRCSKKDMMTIEEQDHLAEGSSIKCRSENTVCDWFSDQPQEIQESNVKELTSMNITSATPDIQPQKPVLSASDLSLLKNSKINKKGFVKEEDGNLLWRLEGGVEDLVGYTIKDDGRIINIDGDMVGTLEPIAEIWHDKPITRKSTPDKPSMMKSAVSDPPGLLEFEARELMSITESDLKVEEAERPTQVVHNPKKTNEDKLDEIGSARKTQGSDFWTRRENFGVVTMNEQMPIALGVEKQNCARSTSDPRRVHSSYHYPIERAIFATTAIQAQNSTQWTWSETYQDFYWIQYGKNGK